MTSRNYYWLDLIISIDITKKMMTKYLEVLMNEDKYIDHTISNDVV